MPSQQVTELWRLARLQLERRMPGVFRANEARRIVPVALEGGRLRLQVPAGVIYDWLAYRRWVVEQELSIAGQAAIVVDLEVERGENSKGPN